jgi:hypothetical protein
MNELRGGCIANQTLTAGNWFRGIVLACTLAGFAAIRYSLLHMQPNELRQRLHGVISFPVTPFNEIHRELGQAPLQAQQQALAEKRSVLRPYPNCPWWPYVWSQQTRVRVGDDGQVPVGHLRHPIEATPRTTVVRCLRPDGDIYYLRHAPDPKAKPIVLLHCPVF